MTVTHGNLWPLIATKQ